MQEKEQKTRYTIRMSPCPVYDIAGMEQWLNDMAAKGLWLCRYTMGLAVFAKREPANLHYQLALLPYEPLMEKGLPAAQDEMIALCEEYGWQYVTKRGRFGIFMTEDEKAQTLHSDVQLESAEYEELRRQEKSAFRSNLLWLLIIAPFMLFEKNVLLNCLSVGTELYLLVFAAMTWHVVNNVRNISQLRRLEQQLQHGESLCSLRVKQRPAAYRIYALVPTVCFILIFVMLASKMSYNYNWMYDETKNDTVTLAEYQKPLPFARLEDVIDGVDIDIDTNDTIKVEHDILAPLMLTVSQHNRYRMEDGITQNYGVYVQYYKMIHPALAMQLAKERHNEDKERWEKYYTEYSLPSLDVDYSIAYETFNPKLILVKNCQVLVVSMDSYGEEALPLEEWSKVYADSLK
ncbi:MAG: DUF2812 domain-containing protein [Peptococcaceae bacterium]|nr:DUF2812 domain-containing protein [Peptococcaceae bacterium]